MLKAFLKRMIEKTGYTLKQHNPDEIYDQDGLWSMHNHEFMTNPSFVDAYQRGLQANGTDPRWHWRVHIGLWAAFSASKLRGDFVECGVNRGFLSSAIMRFLDWNSLNKTFYLLDTFAGIDERQLSQAEIKDGILNRNKESLKSGAYISSVESVKANFSEWKNVQIIQGTIPETLKEVQADQIAYLSLDMNNSAPEVAAIEYFWDRLVPGAFVLMDDYTYHGFRSIKLGHDAFAKQKNVLIASLPTGQGLLIKPAR